MTPSPEERLSYLLSTNDSPTPLEIATIRYELARKRDAMVQHQQALDKLASECRNYEMLLAPLRCLTVPPEILAEIFSHAIRDWESEKVAETLRTFCLVCRSWRDAALATPRLWASVDVVIMERLRKALRFDRVKTWLSRAGTIPRKFGVSAVSLKDLPCDEDCTLRNPELVKLLAEEPIKFFSIRSDYVKCIEHLFDAVESATPTIRQQWNVLESLRVDAWDWDWVDDGADFKGHLFKRLPTSITSLHLKIPLFELGPHFALPPLSLPNLKDLYLRFELEVWHLKSLAGCPNLETAILDFDQRMLDSHGSTTMMCTVPKLRTLQLWGLCGRRQDSRILKSMSCPSLDHMYLNFCNELEDESEVLEDPDMAGFAEDVVQFVTQSKCVETLLTLRLDCLNISVEGLLPIFSAIRSVTFLTLDDVDVDASLFERIMAERLLPRLQALEILDAPPSFDHEKVLELVEARMDPVEPEDEQGAAIVPLKKVTVQIPEYKTLPTLNRDAAFKIRLDVLREKGVDITVELGRKFLSWSN